MGQVQDISFRAQREQHQQVFFPTTFQKNPTVISRHEKLAGATASSITLHAQTRHPAALNFHN
jgi:hypothetical protein